MQNLQAELYLGLLKPEMDVCDSAGKKLGSVAHIYRHDLGMAAGDDSGEPEVMEVKTGLLGLGKHLFVPLAAIQELNDNCAVLKHEHDEIVQQGWDHKPSYVADHLR